MGDAKRRKANDPTFGKSPKYVIEDTVFIKYHKEFEQIRKVIEEMQNKCVVSPKLQEMVKLLIEVTPINLNDFKRYIPARTVAVAQAFLGKPVKFLLKEKGCIHIEYLSSNIDAALIINYTDEKKLSHIFSATQEEIKIIMTAMYILGNFNIKLLINGIKLFTAN